MKVYSPADNYKLSKVLLAANIFAKEVVHENVDYDPKVSKPFKETYPQYSLPVLQINPGKFITGTNAILLYLSAGDKRVVQAKIIQHLQIIEKELEPATGVLNLHSKGYQELNEMQL